MTTADIVVLAIAIPTASIGVIFGLFEAMTRALGAGPKKASGGDPRHSKTD